MIEIIIYQTTCIFFHKFIILWSQGFQFEGGDKRLKLYLGVCISHTLLKYCLIYNYRIPVFCTYWLFQNFDGVTKYFNGSLCTDREDWLNGMLTCFIGSNLVWIRSWLYCSATLISFISFAAIYNKDNE